MITFIYYSPQQYFSIWLGKYVSSGSQTGVLWQILSGSQGSIIKLPRNFLGAPAGKFGVKSTFHSSSKIINAIIQQQPFDSAPIEQCNILSALGTNPELWKDQDLLSIQR